jgi:hypothetical protein
MTVITNALPGVGWMVQIPGAGWLLHARHGMAPTAPCGDSLRRAWQASPVQAIAHKVPLCPKCFESTQTAARP